DFSTEAMLQPDDPALSIYDDFRSEFERDDTLVIALSPPEVFDLGFLETLRAFHTALDNELPYVDDITSLINARSTRGDQERLIVEELMVDWPENAEDLARLRAQVLANPIYANTLISRQADLTMIVVQPQVYASDEGVSALSGFDESEGEAAFLSEDALNEMVQSARSIAQRFESPDFPVHIVGEPVISDHMNRVSQADTSLYTGLSIALIIVLLYALFRRVSAVVLSLIVVVISAITSFGWMALLGIPFTTPSQILPSLILAVGICDSVHILAIVYQGLAKGQERELAIANALEHSGLAVVMTSLTTAAGLVSFIGASIRPVSDLGLLAPIAIMTALFYTLTLLPALLALWPLSPARNQLPTSRLKSALTRMGGFSMRRPVWVLSGTLALVTFSGIGIAQLRFGLDTLAWIPEDDPIRVATELIDSRMEGIGRVEILIDSHREDGLLDPENLARIEAASKTAESFALGPVSVGKTVSLVDIAKETHQALNENNPAAYVLPQDRPTLAQEMLLFENSGWEDLAKVTTTSFDRARLSLQVPMVDAVFYPDFLEELQKRLERILGDDLTLQITGATALTSNSFLGVMHSMASSYVFALVLITPLMILMLGNLSRGLLCMIPNLLPVVVVLGYMGWMDIPLNLPTLLIGGIIIG
ncbi:MAG: MMPL family transporter, partial [bacterium]|nr:MMPL family transporter [bacterium]